MQSCQGFNQPAPISINDALYFHLFIEYIFTFLFHIGSNYFKAKLKIMFIALLHSLTELFDSFTIKFNSLTLFDALGRHHKLIVSDNFQM